MALGKLIDTNLATSASYAGGDWPAPLPLANLATGQRYIVAPARCADCTDLANSQFEVTLAVPRTISIIALLFHTMSQAALFRLTIAGPDLDFDTPVYASEWTQVYSTFYPYGTLAFEVENWFTGQISAEDLNVYPRNRWFDVGEILAGAIRIEIDDRTHELGWFDIGGLLVAPAFSPRINYERGRDLTLIARDLNDETPSGRVLSETRAPRRQLSLQWSALTTDEAYRFIDAGMRAGTSKTVFFLPDASDEIALMREAFPATFHVPPGAKFTYATLNSTAAVLKEILA